MVNRETTTCAPSLFDPALEARSPARSLRAIAEAFGEASAGTGSSTELKAALTCRAGEIDLPAAWLALRSLIGVVSEKTGETPRSVLEAEFTVAPTDEFWRAAELVT